jgi:ABC-type sulfate/molybdate transport systems ATPase subunit
MSAVGSVERAIREGGGIVDGFLLSINREKGTTVIIMTYNMLQAENLADGVAILNNGRIELIGTFQEVWEN